MGLISMSVPGDQLIEKATEIARRLAKMSQEAIRGTKQVLNHWYRAAQPAFEHSLTLEILGYYSDDIKEGRAAFEEKREPIWPARRTIDPFPMPMPRPRGSA